MENTTGSPLNDETSSWCTRAEELLQRAAAHCDECLALVHEGISLRRQWDRLDRDAPQRRRLLTVLADAQIVCHQRFAESIEHPADLDHPVPRDPRRVEQMVRRLADDDGYLAELLNDHTLPAETIAFAVECFRDDLHWLGTLVALLDGTRGIDFTGRVLLEQESLQRAMQSWEDGNRSSVSPPTVPDELRESAQKLRVTALARQAESLLDQPDPQDFQGWHQAWQAASRLAMRPQGSTRADLELAVQVYRSRAMSRWSECLADLPPDTRAGALRHTADELADAAGELLTFMEDLPLVEAVRSLEILAEDAAACMKAVEKHGSSDLRDLRRRLRRRMKAVAGELQERRLAWRMEGLFGRRAVAALERLILVLLILFVVMLVVETPLVQYERDNWPGSNRVEAFMAWADLVICTIFLAEFTLKMSLARPRQLFLRRNWVTMLLPSIPFGFIMYMALSKHGLASVEAAETIVLLRLFRLPRMIRFLRFARPLIRAGRLAAFVMQASDRLIRRVAPLLNRNLVLFERAAIKVEQPPYRPALAALRERFRYRASEVISGLPQPARRRLVQARIEDLTAMLSAPRAGMVAPTAQAEVSTTREIPLERIIARLLAATPAGISEHIGRSLAQSVARWCRAFDVFGVRRLPVVRDLVAAGRRSSPYGATAEVANRIGALLKHGLDRVYWVADLYGTLTAPQLVDSIGDWMVKGTARPARRLLILGVSFLAVTSLAGLLPFPEQVRMLNKSLERLIGAPLVVLGLLCLVPLCIGLWFRQIAEEATDFCSQVAEAQFITATKQLKRRFAKRYHAVLYSRVIAPELEFCHPSGSEDGEDGRADPIRSAVELLFDDYLDGAPFHASDTKTTNQLLGNLTLVSLRETRLGYGRRERKRLRRLDLASSRLWLRGPYLWFHFISRSLAQQTAKLVVDYNVHALPLNRAATADDQQVRRYVAWLSRRLNLPIGQLNLAAEFHNRYRGLADETDGPASTSEGCRGRDYQGNDFTAIHFLSADPRLEADVRRRYGDEVAGLMRRDRRDNIRRVFRTYPFHRWPKQERTFNPLAIHSRFLAGGRVLLLPLRMLGLAAKLMLRGARLLWTFVREVLYPTIGDLDAVAEPDPFAVAVRKIHRMRKPVFLECLRMRARFDPEYLGVSPPGSTAYVRRASATPIEEDLALIDADPGVQQEFRALANQRRRQMLEFRRLLKELNGHRQSGESLRASAIAYTIDYHNVRSRWEAARQLKRTFDDAIVDPSQPAADHEGSNWSLRTLWCRWRYGGRINRLLQQPAFAGYDTSQRKVCRRSLCRRRGPLLDALCQLTRDPMPDPLDDARKVLLAVARDPATWSRQLVVLRAVQTLSVLDLKTYCDLVHELGEYDPCALDATDGMVASEEERLHRVCDDGQKSFISGEPAGDC